MSNLLDLLQDVAEFLEPYVDVKDGSDGPRPNEAMSLSTRLGDEIMRLKSQSGPIEELARMAGWVGTVPAEKYLRRYIARTEYLAGRRGATPQRSGEHQESWEGYHHEPK